MAVRLATAVHTAVHGYAWSAIPAGLDAGALEEILSEALAARPDFAEDADVTSGVIVRGGLAAAFTIRRVAAWDAEGRDADYAAFAFLPCAEAAAVDFAALLKDGFFTTPTRTPPAACVYEGPSSETPPLDAPGRLLCQNRLAGFPTPAIGALLSAHAKHCDRWRFDIADGTCAVTTSPWHR